jgi:hypothetical protein
MRFAYRRPRHGDVRVRRQFLFLPLELAIQGSEAVEWRWLEWANIRERLNYDLEWVSMCFVDDEQENANAQ